MTRPALWPPDKLLVSGFLAKVPSERERVWRRNFFERPLTNGARDLGVRSGLRGFPLFSPRGRLGFAEAESSLLIALLWRRAPIDRQALCIELPQSLRCPLGEKVVRELP